MDESLFAELVAYVSGNVEHDLDRYAYRVMGETREPLSLACPELSDAIDSYAEEWCVGNGIGTDEYYGYYNSEDVFMHDNYTFDS